jgi:hypothetical protein
MAVEHYLCSEGGMRTDLDRDMAPVGIHDVEGVLIYIGLRVLAFEMGITITPMLDLPYRSLGSSNENTEEALEVRIRGNVLFSNLMLFLTRFAEPE